MPVTRIVAAALTVCLGATVFAGSPKAGPPPHSVAREWNELLLTSIRNDFARPTIHARNLFHTSVAMYDAWAAYDATASTYLTHESRSSVDVEADRAEAISYAMYRLLRYRFAASPGAGTMYPQYDAYMDALGYDKNFTDVTGLSPAALGNRIANNMIVFGLNDKSNEENNYANTVYVPINEPLVPDLPGNPKLTDPQRWQPLALDFFIDQNDMVIIGGFPPALSPEWGQVWAFGLPEDELTIYQRDNFDWWVYHDPGPVPVLGGPGDADYKAGFEQVVEWSGLLDPSVGGMIEIGPSGRGNNTFGTNDGTGYATNPATGLPYPPNVVPEGDYYRVLAEFWADGPASETPPGHWFTIANYVLDNTTNRQIGGTGPVVNELEYDVKLYLSLGGAMHDAAVAAWGVKGWYDFIRPVSAIRYMADLGQCSDDQLPSYHPNGINLKPGKIELVTAATTAPGERHVHLAGNEGKIAIFAWRGPDFVPIPEIFAAGVGWILAENWWPYQRPTFVTPPFAGYVSGHSTFSRTAAELLSSFTGSEFFPGGVGEFFAEQNEYLVFEEGPSVDITLQWAKYADAADECSLSRIYGGIHPPIDDVPGRIMGKEIGPDAYDFALSLFDGTQAVPCPGDGAPYQGHGRYGDGVLGVDDLLAVVQNLGTCEPFEICPWDVWPVQPDGLTGNGATNIDDLLYIVNNFGVCPD
jgi:hypothetical protein